ncbi:hypothetical protein E4198_22910 [Streptomyces sp. RKND-216]|uniref:hypothetical protein n=1 Tax=Streptomyces sp. RKND-216 TaxID=2562581 RepID=UPI00109DEF53|nr:hypothetical protein [Streptomyces sp. RKND-216]THA27122.1 hypothetical protein E4198_22910 [Streptomyces sp. RKND-216]
MGVGPAMMARQHRKIEAARVRRGAPPGKPAMHLLRLQLALLDLLCTGTLTLDVGEQRDELLAIRHDETPWAQVEKRFRTLRDGVGGCRRADAAARRAGRAPDRGLPRPRPPRLGPGVGAGLGVGVGVGRSPDRS